jgi:hypothetical protein
MMKLSGTGVPLIVLINGFQKKIDHLLLSLKFSRLSLLLEKLVRTLLILKMLHIL